MGAAQAHVASCDEASQLHEKEATKLKEEINELKSSKQSIETSALQLLRNFEELSMLRDNLEIDYNALFNVAKMFVHNENKQRLAALSQQRMTLETHYQDLLVRLNQANDRVVAYLNRKHKNELQEVAINYIAQVEKYVKLRIIQEEQGSQIQTSRGVQLGRFFAIKALLENQVWTKQERIALLSEQTREIKKITSRQ